LSPSLPSTASWTFAEESRPVSPLLPRLRFSADPFRSAEGEVKSLTGPNGSIRFREPLVLGPAGLVGVEGAGGGLSERRRVLNSELDGTLTPWPVAPLDPDPDDTGVAIGPGRRGLRVGPSCVERKRASKD
jgi:hypothetical protein